MKKYIGVLLFYLCMAVVPLWADEVKSLQLKKGEKYQLRLFTIETTKGVKSLRPMEQKTVVWRNYDFSVTEEHRKKGFVIEMERKNFNFVALKRSPGDPRWQETGVLNSDIESPGWPSSIRETAPAPRSRVKLSPDLRVLSIENPDLKEEEDIAEAITEMQALFSAGKQAAYRLSDTVFREQYPDGIVFMGDWTNKVYEVEKRVQTEIRFCRIDSRPFSVVSEGEKEQYITFQETNTTIRGEIKNVEKDTFIRVTYSRNFPVYSKQVCRVPVVQGKFEFRIFLNEPLQYVNIDENHSLYIEPGDELTVTLDAVGGKKIEMTGQGAGNNRYYHGNGANWGYSLYRIDREKLCSRDYYKALDEKADHFRKRMEARKSEFTLGFYQYMLNCFKYRPVYQKLIADRDSTVGAFDCIEGVEICNPLAVGESEYMSVLRHVMLFVMPKKIASITGAEPKYGKVYDMAGLCLDGKVLNAFLVQYIAEQLLRGDYEEAKELYERYREDFTLSPYTGMLDEQYAKSQLTAPGSTAPEFTLQDLAGKKFSLSDFRGKVVYIDFWSMGCGPCMYEFKNHAPQLKEHYKDKDVVFLNLMAYTRNKDFWKKMIEEYRIGGVNAMDTQGEEVCKAYHVNSFPTYVLVGKDGKIVQYNTYRPSEGERLKGLIDKALE